MQQECGGTAVALVEGFTRTMPPPAIDVGCFIDQTASGFQFRVRIEQRSTDGSRYGLTRLCGTTAGTGNVGNSRVSAVLGAAQISNVAPGGAGGAGGCDVKINSITATSISGQFRCAQVRDNAMNARRINGIAPPGNPFTREPEWADFEFSNCITGAGACM
jgi:hypothetical protein